MKSRVAILAMLVTGMVFSTAGAGLALSGHETNASVAQYGTVTPTPSPPCTETPRSEEHTSELQSPCNLVCRLLLEKNKDVASHSSACCRVFVHHCSDLVFLISRDSHCAAAVCAPSSRFPPTTSSRISVLIPTYS